MLEQSLGGQPIGDDLAFGVVGDGEKLVAALDGGLGHLLDGGHAVRSIGMRMQIATDVGERNKLRESTLLSRVDFAAVLAQFRLDKLQTKLLVNLSFRLARDGFDWRQLAGDALDLFPLIELVQAPIVQ